MNKTLILRFAAVVVLANFALLTNPAHAQCDSGSLYRMQLVVHDGKVQEACVGMQDASLFAKRLHACCSECKVKV